MDVSNDQDIIHLNVGGVDMATERSTLCQITGSFLASMFNKKWEYSLGRDENDRVFLDLNPEYFRMILEYLRAKKTSNNFVLPALEPSQVVLFTAVVECLGLQGEFLSINEAKYRFETRCGAGITVTGNVAEKTAYDYCIGYVLSEQTYCHSLTRWELRIESIKREMFIGVLRHDREPYDDRSYDIVGSYGWRVHVNDDVITSAVSDGNHLYTFTSNIEDNGVIELILNCTAAKLSLVLSPRKQLHLQLPELAKWKLHINLFSRHDKIRILSPLEHI